MRELPRRRYLGIAAGAFAAGLAGCSEDDEPEFLVTNVLVIHQEGFQSSVDYTYPDDMLVRVTIENEFAERREGTVVVELEYAPEDEVVASWEQTQDISLGRTQSPQQFYVFPDAYRDGSAVADYRADAYIETDGE